MALDVHGQLEALWSAPIGIGLLDEDLRFLRVNEAFARFDCVPAAAHQGKTLLEILPEQDPALGEEVRRVRAGAAAVELEIARRAHAGGPPRTWRLSLVPLRSGDAGGVGVLVVDVTDARRGAAAPAGSSGGESPDAPDTSPERSAEARLRRYELLARMTGEIVLFVRRSDGRIVDANAAAEAAYGYAREELLARTIHDLRLPGTAPLTHQQMAQADTSGILFETVHRR